MSRCPATRRNLRPDKAPAPDGPGHRTPSGAPRTGRRGRPPGPGAAAACPARIGHALRPPRPPRVARLREPPTRPRPRAGPPPYGNRPATTPPVRVHRGRPSAAGAGTPRSAQLDPISEASGIQSCYVPVVSATMHWYSARVSSQRGCAVDGRAAEVPGEPWKAPSRRSGPSGPRTAARPPRGCGAGASPAPPGAPPPRCPSGSRGAARPTRRRPPGKGPPNKAHPPDARGREHPEEFRRNRMFLAERLEEIREEGA